MIAIVDYGMGNLRSVFNALEIVGGNPRIVSNPDDLDKAERIVLPGVGAFGDCINNLCRTGFKDALEKAVLTRGLPILGICLGMQVMAMQGSEFGDHEGLGWFSAKVARKDLTASGSSFVELKPFNAASYAACRSVTSFREAVYAALLFKTI